MVEVLPAALKSEPLVGECRRPGAVHRPCADRNSVDRERDGARRSGGRGSTRSRDNGGQGYRIAGDVVARGSHGCRGAGLIDQLADCARTRAVLAIAGVGGRDVVATTGQSGRRVRRGRPAQRHNREGAGSIGKRHRSGGGGRRGRGDRGREGHELAKGRWVGVRDHAGRRSGRDHGQVG